MKWWYSLIILFWLGGIGLSQIAFAKDVDEITLVKAGFTLTPSKEDFLRKAQTDVDEIELSALQDGKIYFWTQIQCTENFQRQNAGRIVVVHRWVRDYGVELATTQIREFSLQDLLDNQNLLQSEQEIKSSGAWFVEIRLKTVDGVKLCLKSSKEKDQTPLCKFLLRVK
jgi:hypothetical protein